MTDPKNDDKDESKGFIPTTDAAASALSKDPSDVAPSGATSGATSGETDSAKKDASHTDSAKASEEEPDAADATGADEVAGVERNWKFPPPDSSAPASRSFLRLIRAVILFVIAPALLAGLVIWALTPPSGVEAQGALSTLQGAVREQPVPISIALFTVFASALWFARHKLPFASAVYPPMPVGVPHDLRAAFERGRMLIEEARSIMEHHDRELAKGVKRQIAEAAEALAYSMAPSTNPADAKGAFNEKNFADALVRLDELMTEHLKKYRKSEFREIGESVFVAVFMAMVLRTFVFEAFKIPSGSMIPTLQVGDHIFVNKFSYGPTIPFINKRIFPNMPPNRGDVMVFRFPERPDQDFIKRVIALPGDKLEAKNGHPWINGWEVPSCFSGVYSYSDVDGGQKHEGDLFVEFLANEAFLTLYDHAAGMFPENQGPFFVKPNEVMVMGDNRHNSHDSRLWYAGQGGGVPYDNIKGRALVVWLSFTDAGMDWSRVGAPVMGRPRLPPAMKALEPAVAKCLRERPPLEKTQPPPAKAP